MTAEQKRYKKAGFTHVVLVSTKSARWVYPRGGGDDRLVEETETRSFYVHPNKGVSTDRVVANLRKSGIVTKKTSVEVRAL